MPYLDAFRLRWWLKPSPKPGPPSDSDSQHSSSSERVGRRISLRLTPPTKAHRSAVPARNLHHASEKLLPATRLSHHESLNEKSDIHPVEQPTDEPLKLCGSTTIVHKSSLPIVKSSLVRRVTSKLRITVPTNVASSQPVSSTACSSGAERSSRPSQRNSLYQSHSLADDFLSRERREAALRERGLRPPRKDLSEQEREADQRLTLVPLPVPEQGEISAASKIKEEWLLMNLSTETRTSDPSSTFSEQSGVTASSHPGSESLPQCLTCDSDCTHPNLPFIPRSSISSSVLPESQSSHLEVLEEEPAEHVPSPLRVQLPIVISTPVADSFPTSSPVPIESPISCSLSSHLAPFSQQHPSLPASPDKEYSYSQFPIPPARRRATNSSNRSRSSVGNSLSKFGTDSFNNLRRSVIGSIRHSGSSADLSTSSAQPSSPRMAVSPTIHNRESIMFETKGIKDAESRRLSELAFLD